jgi:hypothetical protein
MHRTEQTRVTRGNPLVKRRPQIPHAIHVLAMILALAPASAVVGQAPPPAPAKKVTADSAGFQEFSARVLLYLRVHKTAESNLPKLKPTANADAIVAHQQELAKKIAEARAKAAGGDIFTPRAQAAFRHAIRSAFEGPDGEHTRATMHQGAPLQPMALRVNQVYPDGVPFTTVPPTLLQKLPKLPPEVAYRIVGQDLLLHDIRANLVVDIIHEAIP